MSWNEWILLIVIILLIFFVSGFLEKKMKPKTRLILSLVFFIALMTWFIYEGAANNFSTLQLIVLIAFAVLWIITFYFRVKSYREANRSNSPH